MPKVNIKGIWKVLKEAGGGFVKHNILKLAASLAYYTVFSIGPMIVVIIFLCDIFLGREAIEGTLYTQINDLLGSSAAAQVQEIIRNAEVSGASNFTAIAGFATLLIGATTVFADIQDSINTIWRLTTKPSAGWFKMILNRILSFSIVVSLGFLLLVTLIINGLMEGLMERLQAMFPDLAVVFLYILNLILTFIVTTILFGLIYKVLPDAVIKWKDVLIGAMSTAVLFMLGKFGITFYIGSSDVGSTYGTAGSLVVILLWVYYTAVILYFGAEFTRSWAARYGTEIHPNRYAAWIKQIEVVEGQASLKTQKKKEVVADKKEETQKKEA
jgi:membrane protein